MIVRSLQPPRIETAQEILTHSPESAGTPRLAVLTGLMGFFCFLPYTSLPVGNNTSLQIGNLLSLLISLEFLWTSRRRSVPFWIMLLFVAPLCTSALWVGLSGRGEVGLSFKLLPVWMLSCLTIFATQLRAPNYALSLLTGIAVATIFHFVVGVWQLLVFPSGVFPLKWLYVNPSFLSVQENAENIAKYNRRPFGVFPEPSAMSSSLEPWVLFWTAHLCGLVRLKMEPAFWQKLLFGAAAAGGLALIILSQSGHAAITLLIAGLFILGWFVRSRATWRTYFVLVTLFGVVGPFVLWLAVVSLSNRLGGSALGNSSWEDRSNSLLIGFNLLVGGDIQTLLFGYGVGQTSPALQRVYRLEAVWSVLLVYVYETGMVGMLALSFIGFHQLRVWIKSRFSMVLAGITLVWLVGITVTTSYPQLLPLWMTLGWLTVWDRICLPAVSKASPKSMRRRVPGGMTPQRLAWAPVAVNGAPMIAQTNVKLASLGRWTIG